MATTFLDVDPQSLTTALNQVDAINFSNFYRTTSTTGVAPGATGADNVLAVYSLPANTFGTTLGQTQELAIQCSGAFGANGNTKRVKIIWNATTAVVGSTVTGGTVISDTGAVTTNSGGFNLNAAVIRAGSNSQVCVNEGAIAGSTHVGTSAPASATATETGAILIAVTGNATTTASDIKLNYFQVDGMF